jgi:general secretion pathway protein G
MSTGSRTRLPRTCGRRDAPSVANCSPHVESAAPRPAVRGRPPDHYGQGGWTLIELVIVMAIITVLASLATIGARNAVYLAKEATLKEDLFRMRDAIDQYYADKGKYPADLQALVTDQYMREVPIDPISQSRDTWQTIPAGLRPRRSLERRSPGR